MAGFQGGGPVSWSWRRRAVSSGGSSVFCGLMASLLSSEHLLLASLSVDQVFLYLPACSVAEHTNAGFWQPMDWLHWALGPPKYKQLVRVLIRDVRWPPSELGSVQALRNNLLISSAARGCLWTWENRALKDRIEERAQEGDQPELKQGYSEGLGAGMYFGKGQ